MGLTKRKFSFSSLRLKTSSPAIEAGTDYDIDTSPPYSPTPSEMERPSLHPQVVFDLRQACAIIVNETNPPDPDEEPDHGEVLRKFEEERKAKSIAQARAADIKPQKTENRSQKSMARSEQRANEKAQKEYARKVEAEARRQIAREAEPERRKVIERQAALRMGQAADAEREQNRKEQPRRYSSRRPPEDVPLFGPKSEPRAQVPKAAAAKFEGPMSTLRPADTYSATMEPLEPTHTKISSKARGKQKEVEPDRPRQQSETRSATKLELLPPVHATIVTNTRAKQRENEEPALDHIRSSLHGRPKTSAAATVDYDGPSGGSSKSTTRSNTEYDNRGRPTSTAVTSAVLTPGDEKRASYYRQQSVDSYRRRSSDESYQSAEASAQAKAWQEHKIALRRAEDKYSNSGRAARPGSKASKRSRRWGSDNDSEYERPLSRAGSIAGSITAGISHYIRPRASQDSMRSGRSSVPGLSRSHSRSSSMSRRSSNGWWRGAGLRRRGSWASFRSTRPDNDEPSKLRKNGEPNLNRPLPALPGLDSYRETKTHIGQLMKAGGRGRKKEKTPRPDAPYALQQQQPNGHIKKDSISGPILRNESMERTLHRYRESQIMQDPAPKLSASQTRQESPHHYHSESMRKDSESSLQDFYTRQDTSSRSHSRQQEFRSQSRQAAEHPRSLSRQDTPLKSPIKVRRGSESASVGSGKLAPMIRGPSYHKELEGGVYPRPMEVSKGRVVDVGKGGMYVHEVTTPSVTNLEAGMGGVARSPTKKGRSGSGGEWERKGGLKGRVGRIFGGRDAKVVENHGRGYAGGGGGRRTVAA